MIVEQMYWSSREGWQPFAPGRLGASAQLVLVFGSRAALRSPGLLAEIARAYRAAHITGCSTAGEICGDHVFDDAVVVTAIGFDHTPLTFATAELADGLSSEEAGVALADQLADGAGLRHVLVLSDGLHVNGSELVRGLASRLPADVHVTGGLSGDGTQFKQTVVVLGQELRERIVTAVGFHGSEVRVGFGSVGGWDPFGPERIVTRAKGNVLFELDGQSALALYRKYLGDQSNQLPASGLLFPLSIRADRSGRGVVRTILSVSDADDSMTFAGDIPEGSLAQLMRANFDRLIEGAAEAARVSTGADGVRHPDLALLISCVGRKMVLNQRVEEEVDAVREVVGQNTILAGFYSYGEISPFAQTAKSELHNQTMTITTWCEA